MADRGDERVAREVAEEGEHEEEEEAEKEEEEETSGRFDSPELAREKRSLKRPAAAM